MNKTILRAGFAAGLSLASATGWASCLSPLSGYQSAVSVGNVSQARYYLQNYPECFGGSQNTANIVMKNSAGAQASAISNALDMRNTGDGPVLADAAQLRGMAAGAAAGKWNLWGNIGINDTRQSYTAPNLAGTAINRIKNNMNTATSVFGLDYGLSPTTVLGVSAAYDDGDGAGNNSNGTLATTDVTGYMIAPYFGMQLSKAWSFDLSAGVGRGRLESTSSESEASRWFAGANLSYNRWFDKIQLTGKASYLHAVERYGDTRDSTLGRIAGSDARNTLDQLRIGGQIGYWMNGVMPVASLAYTNDPRRKTTQFGAPGNPIGRDGWLLGLGLNFYSVKDGVTGGVMYNREFGRGNQNLESLIANINLRF